MKNNYLNKVLDQIVRETTIDYGYDNIYTHFNTPIPLPFNYFFSDFIPFIPSFIEHCREVYGLNDDEVDYVWREYKKIIKDKIS